MLATSGYAAQKDKEAEKGKRKYFKIVDSKKQNKTKIGCGDDCISLADTETSNNTIQW